MRTFCLAAMLMLPIAATPIMLAATSAGSSAEPMEVWVYVGTYTGSGSEGIYVATLNLQTGQLSEPKLAATIRNPSFLTLHPHRPCLYAVSEESARGSGPAGRMTAFTIDPQTGALTKLNSQSTAGDGPCHITVDRAGSCVLAANYSSGTVVSRKLNDDGSFTDRSTSIQHQGSSVNKSRQEKPHAHCIQVDPGNRFALAADLGTDQIMLYRLDPETGRITPHEPSALSVPAGSGPRHIAFHPTAHLVFVCQELTSMVSALKWDGQTGRLTPLQLVSSLPAGFQGENSTAEILAHPGGKFVYVSNRGHDSIACFSVSEQGTLTLKHHTKTMGKTPRNFNIDPTGRFLLAANQQTGNVVVFRIDQQTGELTPTGSQIKVSMPVCLKFLAK